MSVKKPAPKKKPAAKATTKRSPAKKAPAKKPAAKGKSAGKRGTSKKSTGRGAGRPPINNPDDVPTIEGKIAVYFENVAAAEERPTFCGLALALGYTSRTTLWNNAKSTDPICEPIKRACLRIEESYEKGLRGVSCTGSIFALKNRGWTDKPDDDQKDDVIAKLTEIAARLTGNA